jgi:flagellar biosynthesis/type III secretory pathway chaperone
VTTGLLDDLTSVLTAQAAELRALVPLLDAQQAALTRGDSTEVTRTIVKQEPILKRLSRLDQRRRSLASMLAAKLGLDASRLSLTAIMDRSAQVPASLRGLQTQLRSLLEAVDVRNRRNAFLVQRVTAFFEGLMHALTGQAAEPAPAYVASGKASRRRSSPRLVDRRA